MNRIKELRKAKGVTVKELAETLGIAQSMLTNYENGSSTPRDQSVWEKLAGYFGVSVSYLMGLTDTLVFPQDWDKGWHPETITIDVERVQKEYIDGKKPLEIIVSNLTEYLLLANLVSLDPAEMETLLKTVQGWIREKHKGRGAVIQLPEDDSPECNEG